MREYTFHCEVVTPLFMGGSDPKKLELRSQSFNGLFRYWFRVGGGSLEDEKRIFGFGGNNARKGLVQIIVRQLPPINIWHKDIMKDTELVKGMYYLNNFLQRTERECAFITGQQFKLIFRFSPLATEDDIKKFFCSVWLAINLGNFGARARRGFGSIKVNSIDGTDELYSFLQFKPQSSLEIWLPDNLKVIKNTLFAEERKSIPCLFNNSVEIYYLKKEDLENSYNKWFSEIRKNRKSNKYVPNLETSDLNLNNPFKVLSFMGCLLMAFRNYYLPDYANLISAVNNPSEAVKKGIVIERALFGLPLIFIIGKKTYNVSAYISTKETKKLERRASPLWFKVLLNSSLNSIESLFIVMKSEFLPKNMIINLKIQNSEIKCSTNKWNALDTFIATLKKYEIIEKINF
ncbi:type III-B CRISPR module RAMP protein Cmr1 [Caldicellulosiruptor morganii]|uniref:Type III-B CRISPR module RAMP protein Cmr1 n=1 Tax=Caldicellulosiruptor morganii TaxID=1387555 RepID=A0ABY7BQC3_9FIRM|nr:type III-B CRISPR module RAMP protein Cmr1 [Caldicellulosiruptor morganii]WAM33726.1 type III-B CRISPR module RAMP protein Cmr1 [Caldicellulosiruptor morganii]